MQKQNSTLKTIENELECRECFKWAFRFSILIAGIILFLLGVSVK
jgi:hypothetical protein